MKFCKDCDQRDGEKCKIVDENCPMKYSLEELSIMESKIDSYKEITRHFIRVVRNILGVSYDLDNYENAAKDIIQKYEKMKRSRDMWMHLCHIAIYLFTVQILCAIY